MLACLVSLCLSTPAWAQDAAGVSAEEARSNGAEDIRMESSDRDAASSESNGEASAQAGRADVLDKIMARTELNGKVFADISKRWKPEQAGQDEDYGIGVDLKRFYVGIHHQLDKTWAAEFVSDIGVNLGSRYGVFVKKAYVEGNFAKPLKVRLGAASLPWVSTVEDVYGYRYIENVIIDRLKYGTSTDWGLHLMGKVGMLSYAVSGVNGNGYGDPSRPNIAPDGEARLSLTPSDGLTIMVGGYLGRLGAEVPVPHLAQRLNGLVAYENDYFRVAGEYFMAENWSVGKANEDGVPDPDRAEGYSVWGSVYLSEPVTLFGRFDRAAVSQLLNPGSRDTYWNAGVEYEVNDALKLALVYKWEQVETGTAGKSLSTSNGKFGSDEPGGVGRYQEAGIWGQYSF